MNRRVVVTGMGLVTPLACGVDHTWQRLIKGDSGIRQIDRFSTDDLSCKIAGIVPRKTEEQSEPWMFDALDWITEPELKKMDTFIIYAVAAAAQAIQDSKWVPQDDEQKERTGVMIGSGIGGLPSIYESSIKINVEGVRRISPFFIPSCLINLASGNISIKHGFRGPNHSVVTACATGAHAIGDAARLIKYGDADVMVAGGTEAPLCRIGIAGFAALRALSTKFNDRPTEASRPWDKARDGFIMGEGAGVLVLEELEHAKRRNAPIYAEVLGYGLSGDAYHMTAPESKGDGAYRAMKMALKDASLNYDQIDYVNAHGTSTALGDIVEVRAIKRLFGDHAYNLAVSSTKSAVGHLLGAAGSTEAIFSILSMNNQLVPPTLNLHDPDEECDLNFVPLKPQERRLNYVMSNSFGFGGTNASLIFSKFS